MNITRVRLLETERVWTGAKWTRTVSVMTRLSIRVDLGEGAFGPGKAQLLELIAQKGSIRGAALAMDMSYRRAWLLLQSIEETFGAPAIVTATGGAHGGGASLSPLGRTLIARYRAVERDANRGASREMSAMANLVRLTRRRNHRCDGPSARVARVQC